MSNKTEKERYIVVLGGCSWEYNFKQNADLSYNKQPDNEAPGGKGANQAVALARAGIKVKMISKIGSGEMGEKILQNLKNNNVDTECVEIVDGLGNDYSNIYISLDGTNDIHRFGNAIKAFDEQMILNNAEVIKNAEFVVLQSKMPTELCFKLIDFCYKNNVKTVLTPCPSKDLKICEPKNFDLLKKVTIITANEIEAKDISCSDNIEEILQKLPNLVMTSGPNGVYFSKNGIVNHIPAIKVDNVVDTTGAGDSFCGYLVASTFIQGIELPNVQAIKDGIIAATLNIQVLGAQAGIPKKENVFDAKYIDLHIHTSNSDGFYSPKEILQQCQALGLDTISITDHDTVQSYFDIESQGLNFHGNIVGGVELSSKKGTRVIDILGYGIDLKKMNAWLNEQYSQERKLQNQNTILKEMTALYKKLEIEFDDSNLKITIGKKSEAYNLMKKAVLANPKNKKKFPEFWGDNFFRDYHTNILSKYFIDETRILPDMANVIKIIHDCGGLAILAHIGGYGFSQEEIISTIQYSIDNGIDGLELKHSKQEEDAEQIVAKFAKKYNLYTTGGSDFHGGTIKSTTKLGLSYGYKKIEKKIADKLLEKITLFQKMD